MKQEIYKPTKKTIWKGRIDSEYPERYHQVVKCCDLRQDLEFVEEKKRFGLLGFKSDEGVRRNLGRTGAYQGPAALREALSNLPFTTKILTEVIDFGDVHCDDGDLESSQKQLGMAVEKLHRYRCLPILLGGGHEISWGHYQGIAQAFPRRNVAIINFDAHYDLRTLSQNGRGSSGTPFLQIANKRQGEQLAFNYFCFGIQRTGNTRTLFETAKKLHVKTIFAEEFFQENLNPLKKTLSDIINHYSLIYVTVCLDVFSSAFAPGVSAPQPFGLYPWHVIPLLRQLAGSGKVVGLDCAELAPKYDVDNCTAKLAASLIADFLSHCIL